MDVTDDDITAGREKIYTILSFRHIFLKYCFKLYSSVMSDLTYLQLGLMFTSVELMKHHYSKVGILTQVTIDGKLFLVKVQHLSHRQVTE